MKKQNRVKKSPLGKSVICFLLSISILAASTGCSIAKNTGDTSSIIENQGESTLSDISSNTGVLDSSSQVDSSNLMADSSIESTIIIPTSVGESFIDSTGVEWKVLKVQDGSALLLTEYVYGINTRYHSEDKFLPFQDAEISKTVNTWYENDHFVSPDLKAKALSYSFQLNDGTVGGNGVENQSTTWESNPSTTMNQEAITIPGDAENENKAFILSVSELNEYFGDTVTNRISRRISDIGDIGTEAFWWLRSPSTHSEYNVWLVGNNGYVYYDPATHTTDHLGFRPALWVKI